MVQGKKLGDQSNGTSKYNKDQQSNMSFQRKDVSGSRGGSDGRSQNGNASSFRTDSAISGNRNQGERVLQKWVPDGPTATDGGLETGLKSKGGAWDQFAENERRFGITTDYDENIYTTSIDKSHPMYKQRLAEADKKAREIERSVTNNAHVAEERITDNLTGDGGDEEDKYSGVRRQNQQDFPPLSSSNNKYTPPARRAPAAQSSVKGAPVDPAIISAQLRSEKQVAEKTKTTPTPTPTVAPVKAVEPVAPTSPVKESTTTTSDLKESKPPVASVSSSIIPKPSPQARAVDPPNATATVERDVTNAFKGFAARERKTVENARVTKARNDKEVKLNDLKKFADSFKLHTPVPSDLVSIIAKDPAKQKEIQEKAKRNAEEAKAHPIETAKPVAPVPESKSVPRPAPASHGTSPSTIPSRQNASSRNTGFTHQSQYNSQSYRNDRGSQSQQPMPAQQNRPPGNLSARLRNIEQNKQSQVASHPNQGHETRLPPTGPSNNVDPNFSRRSSGVTSAQGARLNPNSNEFRPSPFAAAFSPNGNPSTGSSPRSALTAVAPTPVTRSLLKRKPIAESDRPSIAAKFNALDHIKTIKPGPEKNWNITGGLKPAYDTPPVWRTATVDDKPESTIQLTYTKLFEMTPFPAQTMSPPHPSHAAPQVPHQHQLPFHLQQNVHMASRQSPRQPQMNMGGQHGHGPNPSFNNGDDHRMMPSHSAQSFASPRMQNNVQMAFPSPMNQPAQLAYNPNMMPYHPGGPPMAFRSISQNQQFMPQQGHMGPQIIMQNPGPGFLAASGMAPGPQMMYPPGGQPPFMPPGNGHPPVMPGVNGYPSPGRGAPMMMSQGSQQGHQQQQPMYNMNSGMSPSPQYAPMYAQQPPTQNQMRGGYGGPHQFGTSPQQMHQFGNQHRNNHQNGNYNNNNKNFQTHGQHANGPPNNAPPSGPQARNSEGGDESK